MGKHPITMKTLARTFLFSLTFAAALSTGSPTEAKSTAQTTEPSLPRTGSAAVATYQTGIYVDVSNRLHVALDKQKGGYVALRLKDANGNVLYDQYLGKKAQQYRTKLNLTNLSDGTYELEITNGAETKRQTVTITTKHTVVAARLVQTSEVASR